MANEKHGRYTRNKVAKSLASKLAIELASRLIDVEIEEIINRQEAVDRATLNLNQTKQEVINRIFKLSR